jgi:ribosomal-protein-serine acetyltransferase
MISLRPTPDIELRPLSDADAPELFAVIDANRDHLQEFLPWVLSTKSEADSLAFIHDSRRHWQAGSGMPFGIFLDGRLVGTVDIKDIIPGRVGEIGYWLAKSATGRGVMLRSAQAVMQYAFEELHLPKLVLYCRPANTRSAGVAHRLGFSLDGTVSKPEPGSGRLRRLHRYKKTAGA